MSDSSMHYCPGCTHGVIHRLVAEAIDSLGIREQTIGVASVGCSVFAYDYFNVDMQQAAHGRAPAVATGIKRVLPDKMVFTYQGDGDLASIGMGEIVHAAARGENITVIFVNNAIYGMTSGQMAPHNPGWSKDCHIAPGPFGGRNRLSHQDVRTLGNVGWAFLSSPRVQSRY